MVKINNFFFLFLCLLGITTHAQKVSNVTFRQEQSTIVISYDLETKTPCKISLFVSTDDGKTWQGPLKKVSGDAGNKIVSGNHSITWNVLEEFEELRGDKIKFQVRADGADLETVKIGTQEWTVKNLDVTRYRNGDIIPEVKDPKEWVELKTGAWCYFDNDPKNGEIYGKLYNWYAVNDRRGLAPEGFHIPSDIELDNVPNLKDSARFNGLPGGYRYDSGIFYNIGNYGNWWSSTNKDKSNAWNRFLNYNYGNVEKSVSNKTNGFSVRCIRD
jgi:hypothetical protein